MWIRAPSSVVHAETASPPRGLKSADSALLAISTSVSDAFAPTSETPMTLLSRTRDVLSSISGFEAQSHPLAHWAQKPGPFEPDTMERSSETLPESKARTP